MVKKDDELYISTKQVLFVVLLGVVFFILAFICKGPTYGML